MNSSNAVKPQQPSPEEVAPSHPLMEGCQIHFYGPKAEGVSVWERVWQFRNRLKRFGKRRLHWLMFFLRGGSVPVEEAAPPQARVHSRPLQPGDRVRIRSRAAIEHSVNQWNELKGCGFMEEMWPYCGTEQVVFKRVERFMDEATYTVRTNALGVPLSRYRSGQIVYRVNNDSFCRQRSFSFSEAHQGGGSYVSGGDPTLFESTRAVKCP